MDHLPQLTEAVIRQHTSSRSYERGQDGYSCGTVLSIVRRDDWIEADVEGSQYEPYLVRIRLDPGGIVAANCSCPYDWGGWCKHIVAALLTCIHGPEELEERPSVESLLNGMNAEQLHELVLQLVEYQSDLTDVVELYVQELDLQPGEGAAGLVVAKESVGADDDADSSEPRPRRTPVDTAAYRRQVRTIMRSLDHMRSSDAYWHVDETVGQVGGLLERVEGFVEAGDGGNALRILEVITEEYMADWTCLDGSSGETGDFFGRVGEVWTEALLTADLSTQERKDWAGKLTAWQEEIDDYGIDEAFESAIAAAEQGWGYPPLLRVLRGEITNEGAWAGEAPGYADDLAVARLNVLARQGRYQEYLYLAQAEGQFERYLTMLVQMGRIREAVDEGMQFLGTTADALSLAQALREQGALQDALRIAKHGLTLQGYTSTLADWLSELASGMGESGQALDAAMVSFQAAPRLTSYLRVQDLSGDRWPKFQPDLLVRLAGGAGPLSDRVDIYLHEGMVGEAVQAVDEDTYAGYNILERVVDAALQSHPDWVIRQCRAQAEPIIERGKAKYYHHAARWLGKAAAAYRQAGRESEWQAYLHQLVDRHRRKYKLVPMLEALQ